jgi:hypothetical protein
LPLIGFLSHYLPIVDVLFLLGHHVAGHIMKEKPDVRGPKPRLLVLIETEFDLTRRPDASVAPRIYDTTELLRFCHRKT